jgi:hypothetical protein
MDNDRNALSEAMKGNKNGIKLKDPDIRQEAYKKYCEHLAKGKSKRSFTFETPEYSCHWQTLEAYIKDKAEFDPLQMEMAMRKGYNRWEQVVEDSAEGINGKANTASLQMLMRNKFGWDKEDKHQDKPNETLTISISEAKDLASH